ncbi:DUF6371 domain-containing protein [Flavicella sediminum]|uniref:DUF6371 domain-containing protein n=1 Tax=Flavicella sediminum TaxID=2585141 RepID=UPI0011235141|nr:DUF6371 domain-containing protein [Flavicella sediminum]
MLKKIEVKIDFQRKRNFSLITPCCGKENKDGKFVNFKNLPLRFGYCHSCGQITKPPSLYVDEKGRKFVWNELAGSFQEYVNEDYSISLESLPQEKLQPEKKERFIEPNDIEKYYNSNPTDNLTKFLLMQYDTKLVREAIQKYHLKSTKDGGTVFFYVNKEYKFQKNKISYYTNNGKRTSVFKVPFKNEDGYYACLFGEHLLNEDKPINLVESEKTALVCSMVFPNYNWLSYGGINGLTDAKMKVLSGERILIIPDISNNAVEIMNAKKEKFLSNNIQATIWDMTEGKSDAQLKEENKYNSDLEDLLSELLG